MISSLNGQVQALRLDSLVLTVGGVGLLVHATARTLAELKVGSSVQLSTTLVVREDSLTLFGFADDDERAIFESVQRVSGIGPKLALAMLSVHDPEGLRRAVATDDLAALRRVPGVGLKSAQRLVLELKGKIGLPGAPVQPGSPGTPAPAGPSGWQDQVLAALVGLGWPTKAAESAIAQVAQDLEPPIAVPTALRAALQQLSRP